MSYDVSALANYTLQNADELVTASVLSAKTQEMIAQMGNIHTGIKSSKSINIFDTDAKFQSDTGCGFNADGTTTFTQRILTVGKIKVNEALCPKDMERTYLQHALPKGSQYESIPFEEEYTQKKSDLIGAQNEIAIWNGDTSSSDPNLNKFDGFRKIISGLPIQASGGPIQANATPFLSGVVASGTPLTGDVALAVVDAMIQAMPVRIRDKEDTRIFCGWDFFTSYILALKYKNLYHYSADNDNGEISIAGFKIKLVAVHGLDGTNELYGIRVSNMHLGTDLEGEEDQFSIKYNDTDENIRFKAHWKLGVQIGIASEIVRFKK